MTDIVARLSELELDNCDNRPFVPFNRLQELFTRKKICELIQYHVLEFHIIKEIVDKVSEGGLRTFVILVAAHDIGSITRFIK